MRISYTLKIRLRSKISTDKKEKIYKTIEEVKKIHENRNSFVLKRNDTRPLVRNFCKISRCTPVIMSRTLTPSSADLCRA